MSRAGVARLSWAAVRSTPLISGAIVVALAFLLTLAAVTGSLIRQLWFDDLPYPAAERLVAISAEQHGPDGGRAGNALVLSNLWRQKLKHLANADMYIASSALVRIGDVDKELNARYAGASVGQLLGARLRCGQPLPPDAADPAADRVVVISASVADTYFAGKPCPVNERLRIDGEDFQVIGVHAADWRSPSAVKGDGADDLWMPLAHAGLDPLSWRSFSNQLYVIGRLAPGAGMGELNAALAAATADAVAAEGRQHMQAGFSLTASASPLREAVLADSFRAGVVLMFTALLLLLLTASIIASLWTTRLLRRLDTQAVFTALGARFRTQWQLMCAEFLLMLAAAGGIALILAGLLLPLLRAWVGLALARAISLDTDVVLAGAMALLVAAFAVLLSYLAAHRLHRATLASVLSRSGKGAVGGLHRGRALAILQFAFLALAAFIGVAIAYDAWERLQRDAGIDVRRGSYIQLELDDSLRGADAKQGLAAALRSALLAEGYTVAYTSMSPVQRALALYKLSAADGTPLGMTQRLRVDAALLPGLQLPLREGRMLTAQDVESAAPVLLLGQRAAGLVGQGGSAVGKHVLIDGKDFQVIGVVADVADPVHDVAQAGLQSYAPYKHSSGPPSLNGVILHAPDAVVDCGRVGRAVHALNPAIHVSACLPLSALRAELEQDFRLKANLTGILLAVLLGLFIFGTVSGVNQVFLGRLRTLAVEVALGARRRDLMAGIARPLRPAMWLASLMPLLAAAALQTQTAWWSAVSGMSSEKTWAFAIAASLVCLLAFESCAALSAGWLLRRHEQRLIARS
jgi:hypothetical protein